jgi:hypothetical protein
MREEVLIRSVWPLSVPSFTGTVIIKIIYYFSAPGFVVGRYVLKTN